MRVTVPPRSPDEIASRLRNNLHARGRSWYINWTIGWMSITQGIDVSGMRAVAEAEDGTVRSLVMHGTSDSWSASAPEPVGLS